MTLMGWALVGLAHGKCAMPGAFVAGDGETLPPDPVLWVFVPGTEGDKLSVEIEDSGGETLAAQIERAPSGPELRAWKVAVDTRREGAHRLKLRWEAYGAERTSEASFVVSEAWKPEGHTIAAQDAGTTRTSWACSHQTTRDLEVEAPGATALELVWAGSASEWGRGEVQTLILPTHPAMRWDERWREDVKGQRIELGYLNCTGEWFEWRQPRVWLGVRALYPDGSRSEAMASLTVQAP